MRTIELIPDIAKETDLSKFPDSTIVNETETQPGTPVIREIYGDVLTNIYKLLRLTGITANDIEDNELNGYQILAALQKLPNVLNDVEQPMNLTGTVFSVAIDISLLPNKYFLFVRSAEASVSSTIYSFKGSGSSPSYTFTPVQQFQSGDELLLIIDSGAVRAYNLSNPVAVQGNEVFAPFGSPLAFNDGSKIYYQSDGVIFSDLPELYDLQAAIRVLETDGTIVVYEMLIVHGFVLCLGFFPATLTYKIYRFAVSDLTTPQAVTISGSSFPAGTDNKPNIYCDGTYLYITNNTGNSAHDYTIDKYLVNMTGNILSMTGSSSINTGFEKTTNAAIVGNKLYTLIGDTLKQYTLSGSTVTLVNTFPGYLGLLFGLNGNIYFSTGEVAKKWTLAG